MGKLTVAVAVSLWVIPVSILVNQIVPHPYMVILKIPISCFCFLDFFFGDLLRNLIDMQDEIFHVPQAREYCKGNFFSWDPMITTPPGLYVICFSEFMSFSCSFVRILILPMKCLELLCFLIVVGH